MKELQLRVVHKNVLDKMLKKNSIDQNNNKYASIVKSNGTYSSHVHYSH